jgi:ArsR family transcriptional regulator, arsenate/arsenite/antimonite-responsive transcriptional repressor / arsenate reductase (thioredoxin)
MDLDPVRQRRALLHRALSEHHRLAIVDAVQLTDRTPGELAELVGLPMNLLAFHLSVLEEAGIVERRRSGGDGRRRYVRTRHEALDDLVSGLTPTAREGPAAERVLFICTHNAARSQLAVVLWQGRTGRIAQSAGRAPARAVHPLAVAVAGARGVDLSTAVPRGIDAVTAAPDLVVTVCDRALEGGVPFPDVPHLHWSIDDPVADGRPAAFAKAYDDVAERIETLAEQVAA